MHTLATRLHVKTASLYNHIPNMDALGQEVCLTALQMQRDRECAAIQEYSGEEAITALAYAYRTFVMSVFMFLTAFANLFGIGGASMISRSLGAGDRKNAKHTAAFSIWCATTVALLYGVAVIDPIVRQTAAFLGYRC